jgi:HEPN domain-containing protein
MTNEEYVCYWRGTAEEDFISMQRLFSSGEFVWTLFVGHLVIEKLLKALCVRTLGSAVPKTHNLLYLAGIAGIETTASQKELMSRLIQFCIRVRYPDIKGELKRTASREYTEARISEIKAMREWLLQLLSEQSNP